MSVTYTTENTLDFIAYISAESFHKLIKEFGGCKLYIPKTIRERDSHLKLKVILGEKDFKSLVNYFGGRRLYIPKGHSARISERNQIIRGEFDRMYFLNYAAAIAVNILAKQFHLSAHSINRIVRESEENIT